VAFTGPDGRKAPNGRSASHIYVDASDNRGAGSSIGGRLRRYCNGTTSGSRSPAAASAPR
jgi:hypothetical protein